MYEEIILLLRACRGIIKTHPGLDALEYAVLATAINRQIDELESMTTPKPRQEGPTQNLKVLA